MNCSQVAEEIVTQHRKYHFPPDVPGWIVVTKNGHRVKLLEPKLNQTLSNCAHLLLNVNVCIGVVIVIGFCVHMTHLIVVLGPSPLDILPPSPSCSQSCLVWQLFNLLSKSTFYSSLNNLETSADLPPQESGHRDGLTGGRAGLGETQLHGRFGLPGSEVGSWQQPIRTHLIFLVVHLTRFQYWTWSCRSLCVKLILRQLWRMH